MSVLFKDKITGLWKRAAANLIYASFPVGSIVAYGGSSDVAAPAGCMYCHGQVLNASEYPELYDVIGTKFGTGDGSTGSFSLPELRGEFLRGAGTNQHSGEGGGSTVGRHQAATSHELGGIYNSALRVLDAGNNPWGRSNIDGDYSRSNQTERIFSATTSQVYNNAPTWYRSRPTNTSVEWIIKVAK